MQVNECAVCGVSGHDGRFYDLVAGCEEVGLQERAYRRGLLVVKEQPRLFSEVTGLLTPHMDTLGAARVNVGRAGSKRCVYGAAARTCALLLAVRFKPPRNVEDATRLVVTLRGYVRNDELERALLACLDLQGVECLDDPEFSAGMFDMLCDAAPSLRNVHGGS